MSHTVNPFIHIALLASVHCKESLVWFKASGFCYTIDTGPSLGLLLDILLLSCIVENLQDWYLHVLQQTIDEVDVGVDQLPWFWAGLVSQAALLHPHHQGELSSIVLASSPLVEMSKGRGQFSFQLPFLGVHPFST